jgi:hypothetical protein
MKICEQCQTTILNFYFLKSKVKQAQENFKLLEINPKPASDEDQNPQIVLHTLEIVKNFIEHGIQSIFEDDNGKRLIIERLNANEISPKQEHNETLIEQESEEFELKEEDFDVLEEEGSEQLDEFPEHDIETDYDSSGSKSDRFVSENVEFVERTPEYLINAFKPSEKSSRPKDPSSWIRNIQRNARARGEEYKTNTGKIVPAKRMRSPCKENCRYKCRTKISEEDREKNFQKYWESASFILQRKFIYEHRKTVPVQRRRFRTEGGKPREYSSHYFLDKHNRNGTVDQVQVCESMFLKTFDICRNIVSYLHKKVKTGKVQDLRGSKRRKLSPGHEAAIEQIKANPFYHIDNPMPMTKLFELYEQECRKNGIVPVKNHTYRKLFAEYNECEFLKKEKFICQICDNYYNASDDEKKVLYEDYNQHLQDHEKCLQRAKGRVRSARKTVIKKRKKQEQQEMIDDMIVEEHLTDEFST